MDQSIGKEQNVPEYQGKNNRSTGDYTANSARNKSSIDIFSSVILKSLFVLYQYGNRKTIVTLSVHEVHGRYRPNYWTV